MNMNNNAGQYTTQIKAIRGKRRCKYKRCEARCLIEVEDTKNVHFGHIFEAQIQAKKWIKLMQRYVDVYLKFV
jgi:hypothetical protein